MSRRSLPINRLNRPQNQLQVQHRVPAELPYYLGVVLAGTLSSPALAEPIAEGLDRPAHPQANQPRPGKIEVSRQIQQAVNQAATSHPETQTSRFSPFKLAQATNTPSVVEVEVLPNFPRPARSPGEVREPRPIAPAPASNPAPAVPETIPQAMFSHESSLKTSGQPTMGNTRNPQPEATIGTGAPPRITTQPSDAPPARSASSAPSSPIAPGPVAEAPSGPSPTASTSEVSSPNGLKPISITPRTAQPIRAEDLQRNTNAADLGTISERTTADLSDSLPPAVGVEKPDGVLPEPGPVPVRGGLRYTDGGYGNEPGYTSFEGFFPIAQTPGKNLTFAEGRLLLQNNAALGTNILLGQRFYNPDADRIYGGYLAYDYRSTGQSDFNQIGVGFETVGADWDLRLNGYFPVGRTRNRVNTFFNNDFRFQGRNLLLGRVEQYESAATVVDLEGGGRLTDWDGGGLRGYVGTYLVSPAGISSAVGVRGRLELRAADVITLNLGASYDGLFSSQGFVSIGVLFPGVSRPEGSRPRGLDRMGDQVVRNPAIVVAGPDIAGQTVTVEDVARNPANGQPYIFTQVNLNGAGGGDGTIENPFGLLADGLVAATGQPNSIVYVQPGTNPGIPAFAIPDNVSVISTAFTQTLPVTSQELNQTIPAAQLPLSGQGTRPGIVGTVTLGNNTLLDGFNIQTTDAPGVVANGIGNAIVRNSAITTTGTDLTIPAPAAPAPALQLTNTTGTIVFTNTDITGVNVPAIVGTNVNNFGFNDATLAQNVTPITTSTATGAGTITSTSSVTDGISLENVTGTTTITANSGSALTNFAENGIFVLNSPGSVTLTGFEISSNIPNLTPVRGNEGLRAVNVNNLTVGNGSITNVSSDPALSDRGAAIYLDQTTGIVNIDLASLNSTNAGQNGVTFQADGATPTANGITVTNVAAGSNVTIGAGFANISNPRNEAILADTIAGNLTVNLNGTIAAGPATIAPTTNVIRAQNVTGSVTLNSPNGATITGLAGTTTNAIEAQNLAIQGSITISGFTVDGTTILADGILVNNFTNATVSRNIINDPPVNGVQITNVDGTTTVTSNQVNRATAGEGILLNTVNGTTNINSNTINTTALNGINLTEVTGTVNIGVGGGNTISNTGGAGIIFQNAAGLATVIAENNQITTATGPGISILDTGAAQINAAVRLNPITGALAGQGINAQTNGGTMCLQLNNNTNDSGITLTNAAGTFNAFEIVNSGSPVVTAGIVSNLQGTCVPIPVTATP